MAAVAPEARAGVTLVANGRNWSSSVISSTNDWLITGNWHIASGRLFSSDEEMRAGAAVCLIGESVRRELFGSAARPGGPTARQADFVRNHRPPGLQRAGRLWQRPGRHGAGADTPLQRRITGNTRVNTLLVSMQDGSDSTRVIASITQLLRERRKLSSTDEDNFNVLDTKQFADTLSAPPRS